MTAEVNLLQTGLVIPVIKNCQRCGKDHVFLLFSKLDNPADEWGWWAMCPVKNQPILMMVIHDSIVVE